jgi:hypothetical protein
MHTVSQMTHVVGLVLMSSITNADSAGVHAPRRCGVPRLFDDGRAAHRHAPCNRTSSYSRTTSNRRSWRPPSRSLRWHLPPTARRRRADCRLQGGSGTRPRQACQRAGRVDAEEASPAIDRDRTHSRSRSGPDHPSPMNVPDHATIATRIVDARDHLGGDEGTAPRVTRKGGSS